MRRQDWFLLLALCLVVLCEVAASQQPSPTVTLRPRAAAATPGIPNVRVTVDRQRVPLGTQVTFNLTPASIATDPRYVVMLYFGDGQRQVMRSPHAVHLYSAVGNYTYAVDVKPTQSCDARVTLNASPASVRKAEPVKFAAQLSGPCENLQYRFVFGDGSSTGWQSSTQTQHSYPRSGNYFAYVDINDGKNRIGGSPRRRIEVTGSGPQKLSVSLSATPLRASSGKPVTFTAMTSPARGDARYQFNFGDGSRSAWLSDPQVQHIYRSPGRYRAQVDVNQLINNQLVSATSLPISLSLQRGGPDSQPSPRPTPPRPQPSPDSSPAPDGSPSPNGSPGGSPAADGSPSPDGSPSTNASPGASPSGSNGTISNVVGTPSPPNSANDGAGNKWWYLLVAAVILFLIYQASGYLFATRPTFAPFADKGVAAVAQQQGGVPISFELVLDRNVSGGEYTVTTDQTRLVTNAPEDEERQTFEI